MNKLNYAFETRLRTQLQGSVLVAILSSIVVFSMLFGVILHRTMDSRRQANQATSWQQALLAAEGGADLAIAELQRSLGDKQGAFQDWTKVSASDPNPRYLERRAVPVKGMELTQQQLVAGGNGSTELDVSVLVDAPTELLDKENDRQWYRIRSTGRAFLPGPATVTMDTQDRFLRKLNLVVGTDGLPADRPQTARRVELVAKPISYEFAIAAVEEIRMNNSASLVNSYDSRSEATSTNGLYDPAKARSNADLATNSQLIDAGGAHIYGNAYTNDGKILRGDNIQGDQHHEFYQYFPPVTAPTWQQDGLFFQTVTSTTTTFVGGGTENDPVRYKRDTNVSLTQQWHFVHPPDSPEGTQSYVELWVTRDFKTSGNGAIIIEPGVHVTMFIEGDVDIRGNGTFNANSRPGQLQIQGVNPPPGQTRQMGFHGNGVMVAAIYAPGHNFVFGATGSGGTFWGSMTGKSISMSNKTVIHYDEALAESGRIFGYRIESYFEHNDLQARRSVDW